MFTGNYKSQLNNFQHMRLKFNLNKINIDPVCHIHIVRHAEELENKHVSGQLYGALYDYEAEVTNIMPFPDAEKINKEQLQIMERRHEDHLNKFNLDSENLGWYFVSYKSNFWDQIEMNQYFQKYINTSFFVVFDYKARLYGKNPYKAFRLKDEFAVKESFKWQDLVNVDLKENNPFVEIPVQVKKNDLFQFLMQKNKNKFIHELENNSKDSTVQKSKGIRNQIQDYIEAFQQQSKIQKFMNDNYGKDIQQGQKLSERPIPTSQFYVYLGQALKLETHEQFLKDYLESIGNYQKVFQKN